VHGDFWDDNVYFHGEELVAVTDLDFMGNRPRVDDPP
jgi:Ser/Thr protein kinase RdoA (MazF antagonist)